MVLLCASFCLPQNSRACPHISAIDASQRMLTLGNDIRYHNTLYYEKARPVISDAEYDRLFATLIRLEKCFPALAAADSPTRKVGQGEESGLQKVMHDRPMLSLSSATGPKAVEALLRRVVTVGEPLLLVQPKVDGLPVELVYVAGKLVSASTRGDGSSGGDVTERVGEIKGIPGMLSGTYPDRVVVRGEVYADLRVMEKSGAVSGSKKGTAVRHPRHVAAGLLQARQPDPEAVAYLRLFPFELVGGDSIHSDREALELLAAWGFPVAAEQTHQVKSLAEVRTLYRAYLANRDRQPFAMDGIVVKVDDLAIRKLLGEGGRAPFWAAAWKFPPESARTEVVRIEWTVGRTGRRTPVAEVAPVHLGGVLVRRVSLQNEAVISRLDIAAGDQVVVGLAGDVIPRVLEVVWRVPRDAGSGAAARQKPEPAPDACLHDSPVCRYQFLARAEYFVSKKGIHISGLGRKRLQMLVEAGLVDDLPSLFLLKVEEVAAVPGFGAETARRLTTEISGAGHEKSFRIVTALGIPGAGPKRVQSLSRQFAGLDMLLAAGRDQLAVLSAADFRTAGTIRTFFDLPGGKKLLVKFRELGIL